MKTVASAEMKSDSIDSCNCIAGMDDLLKPMGGKILVNLVGPPRAFVSTYQLPTVKGKRRKKVPLVRATFCPFCGVKYASITRVTSDGAQR